MRFKRLLTAMLLLGAVATQAQSIVERHGALKVTGNRILDKNDVPLQLTGMSLFQSNYGEGIPYFTLGTVNWLVKDWKCPLIRVPVGISSSGTYSNLAIITKVIEASIANGVYVIIDWHEEQAVLHTAQSKAFFGMMAKKYGSYPNVIFEVYNEPNGTGTTWSKVKLYAEAVIDTIRVHSNNLVIVGDPNYSSRPDQPADAPITKFGNIAYAMHFYAGDPYHVVTGNFGDNVQYALDAGVAVFVSEWGTTSSDGGQLGGATKGAIFANESNAWFDLMNTNKISSCNWSISNKAEGSAALYPTATGEGGWDPKVDVTPSGNYARNQIIAHCAADSSVCPFLGTPTVPTPFAIPGIIPTAQFDKSFGLTSEVSTEATGGNQLGSIDSGDWGSYPVSSAATDTVEIRARVLAPSLGGTMYVRVGLKEVAIIVPPSETPEAWFWAQAGSRMPIPAGNYNLEVRFVGAGSNLLKVHHLELVPARSKTASVPGPIVTNGFLGSVAKMGIVKYADDQPLILAKLRNTSNVTYIVNVPNAGSFTLLADAASASKGGSLSIRSVGTTTALNKLTVAATGGWDKWTTIGSTFDFAAGDDTLTLTATGDTSALFSLTNLRFEPSTSVLAKSRISGLGLTRSQTGLLVSMDATRGYRELQLVTADGRILAKLAIAGLSEAHLPVPMGTQPLWVRLKGQSSTTLAVPPTR